VADFAVSGAEPFLGAAEQHEEWFLDLGCNWGRWCLARGDSGTARWESMCPRCGKLLNRVAHELNVRPSISWLMLATSRPDRLSRSCAHTAFFSISRRRMPTRLCLKPAGTRRRRNRHGPVANRYGVQILYTSGGPRIPSADRLRSSVLGPRELVATADA